VSGVRAGGNEDETYVQAFSRLLEGRGPSSPRSEFEVDAGRSARSFRFEGGIRSMGRTREPSSLHFRSSSLLFHRPPTLSTLSISKGSCIEPSGQSNRRLALRCPVRRSSRQVGPNRDETCGGSPPETGPPASYRCFGMEGIAGHELLSNGLHPCRETANFHEFRPVTYVTPPPPKPVYPELRRRA